MSGNETFPLSQSMVSQLAEVASVIGERLDVDNERLSPFLDYLKQRPGKMLRASMVLLSAESFGTVERVHIEIAAAVEMIQAATLLHDDVIDGAQVRRAVASVNVKWNNETAVLLGDFLLCRAFKICTGLARSDITAILADTADTICLGEITQIASSGDYALDVESYIEIIRKKTAIFFADCCRIGALTAYADTADVKAVSGFGLNFGLAFQIADDLSDLVSDEASVGKTIGRDIYKKNLTLPLIYVLKNLSCGARADLVERLSRNTVSLEELSVLLRKSGSVDYTKSKITHYIAKALESLKLVKNLSTRRSFAAIADSLADLEF